MADLEKLLERQSQLARSIDRAVTNFKKAGREKMTVSATRGRLDYIKEAFGQYQDLNADIASRVDDKTKASLSYFTESIFEQCEDAYLDAVDFFQGLLEQLGAVTAPSSPPPSSLPSSQQAAPPTSRAAWQLPAMKLPSFDGVLEKWEAFRDQFTSLVISDKSLTETDKMHYLVSALTSEAKMIIAHLPITESNFQIAWEAVSARYANPRRLISRHLQLLFTINPIASENAKDLRGLYDRIHGSIKALRNLNCPVDQWDIVIVHFATQCLDKVSRKAWELRLGNSAHFPSFDHFSDFLETRVCALESIVPIRAETPVSTRDKASRIKSIDTHVFSTSQVKCPVCNANHLMYKCPSLLEKSPAERFKLVKRLSRCINCFAIGHSNTQCKSPHNCRECKQRHHSLLHFPARKVDTGPVTSSPPDVTEQEVSSHLVNNQPNSILLSTARVSVSASRNGCAMEVRALVDPGSVATLMTEGLARRLNVQLDRTSLCVSGIGGCKARAQQTARVFITPSKARSPVWSTTAVVLGSLTNYVPVNHVRQANWNHFAGLRLADDRPFSPDPIELIIGADIFHELILNGVRRGSRNGPIAQRTRLGWILSGPVSSSSSHSELAIHHGYPESLDDSLRRFWELEEIPAVTMRTGADDQCEQHFVNTHSRDDTGRYVLKLPFASPDVTLGESRHTAIQCLMRMERRLQRHPSLSVAYNEFMRDYLTLGHMEKIEPRSSSLTASYFIPHHAVIKDNSLTSRLRVVFNASCSSSNGKSLNDLLLSGPKLQVDIIGVLLRWRQFRYVYTADIAKMYRQILIHEDDRDYQKIVWRESPSEPVQEFRLKTVTYGTSAAPFMAIRVLQQLVLDEGLKYPLAVPVLQHQTYVDDCIFGSNDAAELLQTRDQLVALLAKAHFRLRKWASNDPSLLASIDPEDHGLARSTNSPDRESISVLGLSWDPTHDRLHFRLVTPSVDTISKRSILSAVAHMFDPLGWMTPVVVTAKILVQKLWLAKYDWDTEPSDDIKLSWLNYVQELLQLNQFSIPRLVSNTQGTCELHGFADASIAAYAAVIYQRCTSSNGTVDVSLVAAKSRVAPIKTVSVPRLELCAAMLLAKLIQYITTAGDLRDATVTCWTDSTITLAWIKQPPSRWKTFVANRVSTIQTTLPNASWRHVSSEQNPADCASRGLSPTQLISHNLWWHGPSWLCESREAWPNLISIEPEGTYHVARESLPACMGVVEPIWDLSTRFSSWPRLLRVTAYILRFVTNCKVKSDTYRQSSAVRPPPPPLTADELSRSRIFWLKVVQSEIFPEDLSSLLHHHPLPRASTLLALGPFLDTQGLMRVRGRLAHADIPERSKWPIILASHPLVKLIINHTHLRNLHAGPTLTLECLRQDYWIIRARAMVRSVIYSCVVCTRERAVSPNELMGDLPAARVTRVERPFVNTGVDYAGPLLARVAAGRGRQSQKVYVVVFVCMATKAIHLELATDGTSGAFIAAYQRFVARRGLPNALYSDNGSNFHGASKELREWFRCAVQDSSVASLMANDQVRWHFIPPAAPHFGGLWEAAVKSVKFHLRRCVGAHILTLTEFMTLLCRVEACLNSRPIAAQSDNIDDYQSLTPAHFLIGTPLTSPPEPDLLHVKENRLSRWQLIQQMTQSFWRTWQRDYLQTLHQRPKWRQLQALVRKGLLVLLRDPDLPPCKWRLGRISECHPGQDGVIRVVTVHTADKHFKRPVNKICLLPVDINTANID